MRWTGYIVVGLVLSSAKIGAQPNGNSTSNVVRPISLEESIRLTLERNLGLQIQRLSPQIAKFNLAGSYGYYDPVLSFSGGQAFRSSPGGLDPVTALPIRSRDTWTEDFKGEIKGKTPTGMTYDLVGEVPRRSGTTYDGFEYQPTVSLTVDQPLLRNFWTDADRTTVAVNKKDLKIAQHAFELEVMRVVNQVEQAYYDLISKRDKVKVQEKALELAQRSADENKKRVEIGTLAPLDEKQSQAQSATAEATLIGARNDLAAAENVLRSLFRDVYGESRSAHLDPTEALLAVPEGFNVVDSWNRALAVRPDYNQLKEELEKQNLLLKFNYNQLFPSLDLKGSIGRNGLSDHTGGGLEQIIDREFPNWSAGAVLSIPLMRTIERNNYRRSKAEQKRALLQLKQLEEAIVYEIDDAVTKARSDYQQIAATRQAREFAEAALQAEQTKLENGKSTSFVVLELQNKLTQARSAEIDALSSYKKSLSNLHFKEGTTLERNKVVITDK